MKNGVVNIMDISKPDKPYECSICPKSFQKKNLLRRHMVSHTDFRNFQCQICMRTYKYKRGLNRHIKKNRIHSSAEIIYKPKIVYDPISDKEIEILFTWKSKIDLQNLE